MLGTFPIRSFQEVAAVVTAEVGREGGHPPFLPAVAPEGHPVTQGLIHHRPEALSTRLVGRRWLSEKAGVVIWWLVFSHSSDPLPLQSGSIQEMASVLGGAHGDYLPVVSGNRAGLKGDDGCYPPSL